MTPTRNFFIIVLFLLPRFLHCYDGDSRPVRLFDDGVTLEDDGLAGLDGQAGSVNILHGPEGLHAHGGKVEPEILVRLADFYHHGALLAEAAAAPDGLVRSLDRLYGQDRLVLDYNRLADVQPADLLGHLPPELDVPQLFLRWFPLCQGARGSEQIIEIERRFPDGYPFGLQLPGHGPEHGVVLFVKHLAKERACAQVGHGAAEEPGLLDTAGHEHVVKALLLEYGADFAELPDLHPEDGVHPLGEVLARLAFVGDGIDVQPFLPCCFCKFDGQYPIACYETDRIHSYGALPRHSPLGIPHEAHEVIYFLGMGKFLLGLFERLILRQT